MKLTGAYRDVLRRPLFRRYFAGEGISSVGDAMSEVTIVVLALELGTGSNRAMAVALASAAYLLPGIVTGAAVGRRLGAVSPRTLLIIDNAWRGGCLGLAAVLTTTDAIGLGGYVALLALASLTRPLGAGGSRTIVVDLVDEDDLFAANSLVNTIVQAAVMLGPAVAGVLAAVIGPGPVLAIDATTFLLFVAALLSIPAATIPPREVADSRVGSAALPAARRWRWAGWLGSYRTVAGLFLLTGIFHALYGPFVVSLPLLVQERAGALAPAAALGLLWSAFGVGAVLGGLAGGSRASLASPRSAALIVAGWGAATVAVGLPAHLAVAGAAMFAGGAVYGPYIAIVSTVMQQHLPPHRLAEASAYYHSVTGVVGPLGTLAGGVVVAGLGPSPSLFAAGGLLIGFGLAAAARLGTASTPATPGVPA
ncbi:MAG: MFS transporter [Acidimicrobiia bacterium]